MISVEILPTRPHRPHMLSGWITTIPSLQCQVILGWFPQHEPSLLPIATLARDDGVQPSPTSSWKSPNLLGKHSIHGAWKAMFEKKKSYLAHAHAPQSILHCAAFSFSSRSHCWNVLKRVHGYGSKFDRTCWDPSLVISRGHSAGGIHVALSKNRGYLQPFEEGDNYPLELGVING